MIRGVRVRAKNFLLRFLACAALLAPAARCAIGEDEFLPPEDAFKYTATADEQTVTVEWTATKGYYLYKKRMGLAAATPGVTVGELGVPERRDPQGRILRRAGSLPRQLQGDRAAHRREGRRHDRAQAQVAGLRGRGPVLSAERLGRDRRKWPPRRSATTADELFDDAKPRSKAKRNFSIPTVRSCSRPKRGRSTTSQLNWRIADGYYLYKQRIKVEPAGRHAGRSARSCCRRARRTATNISASRRSIGRASTRSFSVPPSDAKTVDVNVTYQGCADAGLCYPPITKTAVDLARGRAGGDGAAATPAGGGYVSEQDSYAEKIKNGNLFLVLLSFFGAGLLLAFTPCVLPMVPILSGIIAGSGENVTTRALVHAVAGYVLGMAFTYTAAGIAAGAIGQGFNLQATFNQPWIVALFSLLFVVLAASMLGLFTIEMPGFIQTRLSEQEQRAAGRHVSSASASWARCRRSSSPPASRRRSSRALTVISQTGDVVRGGAALFVDEHRHGHAAAAGRRFGRQAAAARRRVDGHGQEPVRRAVPRRRGVDAVAHRAGLARHDALGGARARARLGVVARAREVRARAAISRARSAVARRASTACVLLVGAALGGTNPLAPIPQLAAQQTHLEFKRIKSRRGSRARSRGREGRRQGRDARFLCGLVRVLQRDGTQHVHAARRAGRARRTPCCCRPTSRRTTTRTRRCSCTSASSVRRPSPSMARTERNGETSASSAS